MSFCTVVNCIDGRVQLPVIYYLKARFLATYVDVITEPGAVRFFCTSESPQLQSILERIEVSLSCHNSHQVAIAAHHECAGNSVPEAHQKQQVREAAHYLSSRYLHVEILGLWVNEFFCCSEVSHIQKSHSKAENT